MSESILSMSMLGRFFSGIHSVRIVGESAVSNSTMHKIQDHSDAHVRHEGFLANPRSIKEVLANRQQTNFFRYDDYISDEEDGDFIEFKRIESGRDDWFCDLLGESHSSVISDLEAMLKNIDAKEAKHALNQDEKSHLVNIPEIEDLIDGEVVTLIGGQGSLLAIFQKEDDGHHFIIFDDPIGIARYALEAGFSIYANRNG